MVFWVFFFLYCTVSVTETLDWVFCVLQEATDGRGVDVIVEMLSNVNLGKDLQLLAHGGRVTVCTTSVFFVGVKNHPLIALNMTDFTLCVRVRVVLLFLSPGGCRFKRLHRDQPQRHHGQREQHHRSDPFLLHTGTQQRPN